MDERHHLHLTRRDFVRGTVGAAVAASIAGCRDDAAQAAPGADASRQAGPRPARSSQVVLVRDEHVLNATHDVDTAILDRMLGDTVMRLTGQSTSRAAWLTLVKPADTVGLVPTDHLNPTHKEVTDAVRRALIDAGIPGDRIRTGNRGLDLARACTAFIALPALKAHWLTGVGTVFKNYIMFSGAPDRYHDANNAKLGEIWLLPDLKGKTRLVLVDALRPLCDKGPQPDPRYMWDYNGLIAGTDPVAVETVGLQIIMAKRQALRGEPWPLSPPPLCVKAADEVYGLGTSRLEEIKVVRAGWDKDALI
jgi:hypothetical protein